MPEITTLKRYKYNGKEYQRLEDIQTNVENGIGRIIDSADVTLTPKQKLNLLEAIVKNKEELAALLDVTFEVFEVTDRGGLHGHFANILDYEC